ncbi:glycosyl hydrolase [soil metagenome]
MKLSFIFIFFILINSTLNAQNGGLKLLPPDEGYIYHGAFPFMGNTEDVVSKDRIEMFESAAGKKIAWVNFSNNWYNGIIFPSNEVRLISSMGKVPYIRLMPRSDYNTFKPDALYTYDNILKGKFDKELHKWAADAGKTGIPLMIEFGTEVNGNWFPWSGIWNGGRTKSFGDKDLADGPEKFRETYRHIIDIFRDEKAYNITWVYHPNGVSAPDESWNSVDAYYPGDDYIDWIGVSVYGSQHPGTYWYEFDDIMSKSYNSMKKISTNKPMAVFEFGVTEDPTVGNKAEWIVSALSSFISRRYPLIKAISYFQTDFKNSDGTITDLKINSSESSQSAYRNLIQSILFVEKAKIGRLN